jgi:heme exporter protein D
VNWSSWSDFLAMGGYGRYVWGSYLVTFGLLAVETALLRRRRRSAIEQLVRYVNRKAGQSDEFAS